MLVCGYSRLRYAIALCVFSSFAAVFAFSSSGSSGSSGSTGGSTGGGDDDDDPNRVDLDEAEFEGAPKENLAVVCDFDWHKEVRDSLVSQQRYEGNIEELNAGFSTLTLDNVPVFKSHAIPRIFDRADGSTYNQAYTVNLDATYLAMLQETSMKPLAKVAPQEQMAFDAYGTLVSEDFGAHVQAATVSPVA